MLGLLHSFEKSFPWKKITSSKSSIDETFNWPRMMQKLIIFLFICFKLITCYITPPSEPFILAAYDPEHNHEHDHILHANVEKAKYDGTKCFFVIDLMTVKLFLKVEYWLILPIKLIT